jgi:hypothetical protein
MNSDNRHVDKLLLTKHVSYDVVLLLNTLLFNMITVEFSRMFIGNEDATVLAVVIIVLMFTVVSGMVDYSIKKTKNNMASSNFS